LGIDLGRFSPALLKKVVYAGSNAPSFKRGRQDLLVLAEVTVPVKQVERLTERIGQERQAQRDAAVAAWLARPLAQREDPPPQVKPMPLAVVEMDGGRLQIRAGDDKPGSVDEATGASGCPSQEQSTPTAAAPGNAATAVAATAVAADSATAEQPTPTAAVPSNAATAAAATPVAADSGTDRPSKPNHWREDKVGCLLEMSSVVSDVDPCPEIPAVFVDPLMALKLAQEIGHAAVPKGAPFQQSEPAADEPAEDAAAPRPGKPEMVRRRVVASRKDNDGFGPLLAAAAWAMGLFSAVRRAFVADGSAENWTVWKRYFCRWVGVLDFVHALTYVYAAAMAGRLFAVGWPVYQRWIQWVWGGQVSQVIEELMARQQELGQATKEDKEGSPRRVVQETLTYLSNQQDKMHYDAYRRQGLPLMSSYVESVVKQINYRVKGTEKFWTEEGAEALLQLRADYLSDDEPLKQFWQRRQAGATGQHPYRRAG
jgi:hypothetical protein